MLQKLTSKIKSNLRIYQNDIVAKGLYWSLVHRLYKIPTMRSVLTPLVNKLKPNSVLVEGHKVFIDKWDATLSQELLLSGKWEEYETELFKKHIMPGDIVVDIGAHIGYYTLIAAKLVGNTGKVYAFEPDTKNFQLLKKNVMQNGYRNVVLVNEAVTDKNGTARLFLNSENTGDHRIFDTGGARKSLVIRTTTLDNFFAGKEKKVDFIKMDIQGSEANAFQGGTHIINDSKQIKIITEFQPAYINMSGRSAGEYLRLLRKSKFTIYEIKGKEKTMRLIHEDKGLLDSYPASDASETNFTNLFCIR